MPDMMSDREISGIKANLFPASHGAISDWHSFPWHRDRNRGNRAQTDKPHSSQALAIDVFGTIKMSVDRDEILGAIARTCGLPDSGAWSVELEWSAPKELLGEVSATQVDAIAFGERSIIVIEAKFTEPGGRCSQTKPLAAGANRGIRQCNGSYVVQRNAVNDRVARCALTAKGIRYWESIPEIFGIDATEDLIPCPFVLDDFQWMRNAVVAHRLERTHGKPAIAVAAFADGMDFPTAKKVRTGGLGQPSRSGISTVVPLSYQSIISIARSVSRHPGLWEALAVWVTQKIETAEGMFNHP
ncbi:PGN_0703 family putative restriction endonuclease [Mesorhizobium sangaii]|uniref:Uncharacterized protein n=1 Tax=Mesorhizobium sangaii TaxID=505389 RepID=A0A841P9M7_9HYPH|nr:hypothetical protein [Mesorhizobium sangaii]MBB6411856.1 hypothetical protein [Mesorhizobium sangaii]